MPITQPTIDDFQDTTVMRVIRKVVNYLVTLIPKVNEEIASVTDNAGQRLDSVEANVEALNKELPTDIRVNYDSSTGNFNIDYIKEDGDTLTSNTVVIVSGSTGEVTIVQNTSGISINGIALQSATTAQPGLMTPALVSSLNNVNDTVNDHTTMINGQADAITELDGRVDALEQAGSGGEEVWEDITSTLTGLSTRFNTLKKVRVTTYYPYGINTNSNNKGNYPYVITELKESDLPSTLYGEVRIHNRNSSPEQYGSGAQLVIRQAYISITIVRYDGYYTMTLGGIGYTNTTVAYDDTKTTVSGISNSFQQSENRAFVGKIEIIR